jgi:hypothetical protein
LVPFFLVDEPVKGRTYSFPNGDKLQLMGGQFVAFGPHKDTNQPYEWENWDAEWPRLTTAQLQSVLAEVPARAGTSLRFSADHETASVGELEEAAPRTQDEWQAGRDASLKYLGTLTNELRGKTEGRGSTIFSLVGVLKFAELNGIVTRGEIEKAIEDAGHHLDEGLGGRTLREEIERHNHLPVLRGNLIMQAIVSRRQMLQGIEDARNLPVKVQRSGFEISLEDDNAELPWIIHQRFLASEVHFLTGHSGAGKSTVATDAAISFLTGRNWLDADIERPDGHVLWVAAEDDYGTERRVRHLLRQEPNGQDLANRFHLIRGVMDPAAFDLQCCGQVQAMAAMGKRVDIIVLDTWGASGLCFADNDTEAVLKAMFILKNVARRTAAALIVTDHLPLGNEDAWQKGNGAKSGNAGFMYRVTAGARDQVSIDCGKARGAPKAKSVVGKVVSENYGQDSKGRTTTVNVFKREAFVSEAEEEQSAAMKLAALLPGAVAEGMDAIRAGYMVKFETVASELGHQIRGEAPAFVVSRAGAAKMFTKDQVQTLLNSGHFRTMASCPFLAVYAPTGAIALVVTAPWNMNEGKMPWQ